MSDTDTSDEEVIDHHTLKNPGDQLLAATINGDAEFVKDLLEKTPSLVIFKDNDGYTVLHRACYSENVKILKLCLDHIAPENIDFINTVTNDGWTPLHSAARWNAFDCVKMLLESGADPNVKSNGGNTPLHLAAEFSVSSESLELLLKHPKINKKIRNSVGETALRIAQRCGGNAHLFKTNSKQTEDESGTCSQPISVTDQAGTTDSQVMQTSEKDTQHAQMQSRIKQQAEKVNEPEIQTDENLMDIS